MSDTDTTVEVVVAARAGDRGATDQLLRAYLPVVYSFVRARVAPHEVDDVVQETCLRAVTALPDLRDAAQFRSWLMAIAVGETRRMLRSRMTADGRVAADDVQELAAFDQPVEERSVRGVELSRQRRETAEAAAWLEAADRELLPLWWLEVAGRLRRAELARALGISPGHAAVRVQRMRERLETSRWIVRALGQAARGNCRDLHAEVAGRTVVAAPVWRKRIAAHLHDCDRCGPLRGELVPADRLLAAVPLLTPAAALVAAVREGSASAGPAALRPAADTAQGGPSGGLHRPPGGRSLAATLGKPAVVAVALAMTVLSAGVAAAVQTSAPAQPDRGAPVASGPGSPAAPRPGAAAAERSGGPAPSARTPAAGATDETVRLAPARTMRVPRATAPPAVTGALPALPDTNYPVPSGAVWVSPQGSDTAAGTRTAPLASLPAAMRKVARGGTVVLASGTYRTGDLVTPYAMTIQPAPHARVWLKGSELVTGWQRDGARWCAPWDRLLTSPDAATDTAVIKEFPLAGQREAVYVADGELTQVASVGEVGRNQFAVDKAGKRLCVGTDPAGRTVESVAHLRGLKFGGNGGGSVLRGIGFAHYGEDAIIPSGLTGMTIEQVTSVRNGLHGLLVSGAKNVTVRSSRFTHNGEDGMIAGSADGLRVVDCDLSFNNTQGFRLNWSPAGAKLTSTRNAVFERNRFLGNYAKGLWLDIQTTDTRIVNNYFNGNFVTGPYVEISRGALITGNVSVDNRWGAMVGWSADVRILHNTFVDNDVSVRAWEDTNRKVEPWEAKAKSTFVVSGIVVANNLMIQSAGGTPETQVQAERAPCRSTAALLAELDYNGYRSAGGTVARIAPHGGACAVREPNAFPGLRALGFERHGRQLDAAPAFAAPSRGDFRLTSDAGLPAGRTIDADLRRALGVPGGKPVRLGAPAPAAAFGVTEPEYPGRPAPSGTPRASARPTGPAAPGSPSGTASTTPPAAPGSPSGTASATASARPTGPAAPGSPSGTASPARHDGSTVDPAPPAPGPAGPAGSATAERTDGATAGTDADAAGTGESATVTVPDDGGSLPRTGLAVGLWLLSGLGLVSGGVGLVLLGRQRRTGIR